RLDAEYGKLFAAHAQIHAIDKYRRNPTSEDKKFDADEMYLRLGPKPDILDRPDGTSFFIQAGKFAHMERQPIRMLESYGVASTSSAFTTSAPSPTARSSPARSTAAISIF